MALTPMMQQYFDIKQGYADRLLFYRLGDFYEMFFDDAILASKELDLTLTGRDCGLTERAPMCGVPAHAVEGYIAKLIEKGYSVAICEQLTDPSDTKGMLERGVTRVITPGTVVESSLLEDKRNRYLLSLYVTDGAIGYAGADVSTGTCFAGQITSPDLEMKLMDELYRIQPAELLCNASGIDALEPILQSRGWQGARLQEGSSHFYEESNAKQVLKSHFKMQNIDALGMENHQKMMIASGALISYLSQTQMNTLAHLDGIQIQHSGDFMLLDSATRRNLELTETLRSKTKKGSLLWLLDDTVTAMGGRKLRTCLDAPLQDLQEIKVRHDAVELLMSSPSTLQNLSKSLSNVQDLERLCGKLTYGTFNARDAQALQKSLCVLPEVVLTLGQISSELIKSHIDRIECLPDLEELLTRAISDTPPPILKEGGMIRPGYDERLDSLRSMSTDGKQWISQMEAKQREVTGIRTLKIGYNRVFGYYIEVSKSYVNQVPYTFIRKQTLAGAERYITEELKEMEDRILGAEEEAMRLEYALFMDIRAAVLEHMASLRQTAQAVAVLDMLMSLAKVALKQGYCKPQMVADGQLDIQKGRHPVVEACLPPRAFVANPTKMDLQDHRMVILTGPNMAGKSTYLRQNALIVLMAHIGSFVPASQATIPLTDRIFTRVGASDDLSSGQSTFMVEMSEVATILRHASPKSLVILDEVGRGTATFDGLSLAWAVIEYLADTQKIGCKTLFATHYHELSELHGRLSGVQNYRVAVREQGEEVLFLRRIERGSADKSFGIHVASLAGLPQTVVSRAKEILRKLEEADINKTAAGILQSPAGQTQTGFFDVGGVRVAERIRGLDLDTLTPMQALQTLVDLKQSLED